MKKLLLSFVAVCFLVTFALAADCNFVASKGSDKYHKADCKIGQNIKAENKVCFKYPEEAKQAGYASCGVCKPAEHTKVVGSKVADKYHLPECGLVKNIKPENLVSFNSPEDAVKAGLKSPCGVCKPPKAVEAKEEKTKS